MAPLVAYVEERNTRRIAFKIAKGETFQAITGNVHVLRPGTLRVIRAFEVGEDSLRMSFGAGDTIYLLDYLGEGVQNIWYRGAVREIGDDYWGGAWSSDVTHDPPAKLIREPKTEWWAKVQNRRGQVGWIKVPDEGIEGADACG